MGWRDRAYAEDEREDDDAIDPEAPDESDMDSHDDPDLDVCPHGRKLISEEAERCPHCGMHISIEDAPMSKPAWVVTVGVILLILLLVAWTQWR